MDLYQLHRIDPQAPLEESMGGLARLQREDRIRQVGASSSTTDDPDRTRRSPGPRQPVRT